MSTRREYETLFKLNAELGTGYSKAFAQAQKEVAEMQEEIVLLNKHQKDISAYQKQQTAITATENKLKLLREEYENLEKEQQETEGFSAKLANAMLRKQEAIEKATVKMEDHIRKSNELADALRKAEINTESLTAESDRLSRELEQLKQAQQGVINEAAEMGTSGAESMQAFADSMIADKALEAMREAYEIITACTEASIGFESAITGVYKTVDGTDEQLAGISAEVRQMALVIPATVDEIAAVAEAAGQLGIATEDVTEFTSVMINLGESTNLSAEDAAESLAKFSNITGTAAGNYGRLGSVIVDLGNNFATTERDIVAMATRLASSGTIAGLTEPEILALAAAMSSVGIEAEAGGTAMTQTLGAIESEVAAGGEGLAEFARIAGMTADDFASTWERAPIEALTAFIGGLGELEAKGENATLVLDGLGLSGVRQSNMLKSLSLAADTMTGAVNTANQAWIENNALTAEAAKRYATAASQQQMAANAVNNLKIAVGDALTPTLRTLYSVEIDVLSGLAKFAEENPALVRGVTATAGVIGVGTTAMLGYAAATNLAKSAADLLKLSIPGVGAVMGAIGVGAVALGLSTAALTAEFNSEAAALRELSEASREEYELIQAKEAEYARLADLYGETDENVQALAREIDYLKDRYAANSQTMENYIAACESTNTAMIELLQVNRAALQEGGADAERVLALTDRLRELGAQTDRTAAAEEEMKAILAELNGQFPGLSTSYTATASEIRAYTVAVEGAAAAQARLLAYENAQKGANDVTAVLAQANEDLNEKLADQASALTRLNAAKQAYNLLSRQVQASDSGGYSSTALMLSEEYKELIAAQEAYEGYTQQVAASREIVSQAEADREEYEAVLSAYAEENRNAAATEVALEAAIRSTMTAAQALATAYNEAYQAAYTSVSGQYSLWDELKRVSAADAPDIGSAIESQITYWQDYNANLDILSGKAATVEGLSDMVATFADGSADSVKAIAGLASASEEELTAMVADWQLLQEEHKQVSESLAALVTEFEGEMDTLQTLLAESVGTMDLSEEAKEAARVTMQAYLDGAAGMMPDIQTAFEEFGTGIISALGGTVTVDDKGHISEMVRPEGGYASGTAYATPGWHLVGENGPELALFGGGETVLNARDTAEILSGGDTHVVNLTVNVNVDGAAAGQAESFWDDVGDQFERRVRSALVSIEEDRRRRSYG